MLRLFLVIALLLAGPAWASRAPGLDGAAVCEAAATRVAAEVGVPADILLALTLTETGKRRGGVTRPWAWSVNAAGAGQWFDGPREAYDFAAARIAAGLTNVDVGCFQLNYHWHGRNFASLGAMFDPLTNARYAARFVADLYRETGDWRAAAGAFHSRRPQDAGRYLARFDQLRAGLREGRLAAAPETYNRFSEGGGVEDEVPPADPEGVPVSTRPRSAVRVAEADPLSGGVIDRPAEIADALVTETPDPPSEAPPDLPGEFVVPDPMRSGGPVDVALDGGVEGAGEAAGYAAPVVGGGAGFTETVADGRAVYAGDALMLAADQQSGDAEAFPDGGPLPLEATQQSPERLTLLGLPLGTEASDAAGSLAVIGGARGGLFDASAEPRGLILAAAGPILAGPAPPPP